MTVVCSDNAEKSMSVAMRMVLLMGIVMLMTNVVVMLMGMVMVVAMLSVMLMGR